MAHYSEGNEWAAAAIHRRYEKRVRRLAQQNWPCAMRSRFDPDDIVQEVFDRFFRAVRRGLSASSEESGLWGFFLVVTLNQIRRAASRHLSRRRDVRQTVGQGSLCRSREDDQPRQACSVHSRLVVKELLAALPPMMRQIVEQKLQGYTVPEIARCQMISHRTVERLLQAVRLRIAEMFEQTSETVPEVHLRLRKGTEKSTLSDAAGEPPPRRMRIA